MGDGPKHPISFEKFSFQLHFPEALRFYESIHKTNSVYDYNPADYHGPMLGSHLEIFQLRNDGIAPPINRPEYLLHWLEIGQKEAFGPGHVETDEYYPLQADFAKRFVSEEKARTARFLAKRQEEKQKKLAEASNPIISVSNWIEEIDNQLEQHFSNPEDARHDIKEMIDCAISGSYRACLTMAGRVLEQVLNQMISVHQLSVDEQAGVGLKIKALRKGEVYLDPSIKDIWNIINKQRIVGVHAKEAVPIPSEDDVNMVIFAVKGCLTRLMTGPNGSE